MTEQNLIIQDLRREVEQLKAELAQRNEMRWISVEDRLPYFNGKYIVCCDDSNEDSDMRIWCSSGVVVAADYFNGCWTWDDSGTEYSLDGIVTHWMPLPDAPKED